MSQGSDNHNGGSFRAVSSRKTSPLISSTHNEMLMCINELLRHQGELEKQIHALNSSVEDMSERLELYTRFFEFTPHGYFSLDRQGTIIQVNMSAASMMGMDRENMFGMDFCVLTCKKTRNRCRKFIQDVFALKYKISQDMHFQGAGTLSFWGCAVACIAPDGRECMVTVMDITRRKQAEADLEHSRKEALKSSQAKTDYLAAMCHEIRTPLSGVVMILEALKGTGLSAEQQRLISLAGRSSDWLKRLLSDILDLSRMEAGKLEIIKAPFSMSELAETVVSLFKPQASSKGLDLKCRLDPQLPEMLQGDEIRIRQAVFNLVNNAVKYTEKGEITVRIAQENAADNEIRVCFSIKDTGEGMESENIGRAVMPFVRLERAGGSRQEGAGLGLNIVSRLVELMGGDFDMKSSPGQGTEARFFLNLERVAEQDQAGTGFEEYAEKGLEIDPLRILYAEDDEVHAMIMKDILEDRGHMVHLAPNGRAVLELMAENHYHCILMDIRMPIMDGIEATAAIRSSDHSGINKDIPIIALTACAMKGDREKIIQAGMDAYLAKPAGTDGVDLILKTTCALLAKKNRER
ncbi:MAG: ATP-binding protein [Desulfonatronovibrionaceae bacterium]